jgi:hypothetical protein
MPAMTPLNLDERGPPGTANEVRAFVRNGGLFLALCFSFAVCVAVATSIPLVFFGRSKVGLSLADAELTEPLAPATPIETAGVEFTEVARERGLRHVWPRQPRPMRLPETFGCGCAAFDYDNDGLQDVLLVADPQVVLYHNVGGGYFENTTARSGLATAQTDRRADSADSPGAATGKRARRRARAAARSADWVDWTGVAVGDYDADGWLDLLLTGYHRLALFKNRRGEKFIDVTAQAGLDMANHGHWASSAGFMDLDGDNWLDLVVLNYVEFSPDSQQYCELAPGVRSACPPQVYAPEKGDIWRNTGHGSFELVPESDAMGDTSGRALVLAFTDVDGDNRQDFFIGNDGTRAEFMHNLGGMQFENIGVEIGVTVGRDWTPMAAMGADWADFDRDGLLDLTVTDFQKNSFALFRHELLEKQDGSGWHGFQEVGRPRGISAATRERLGFGAKWLDMDNDGWPDICYANGHVYDNAGEIQAGETLRQSTLLMRNEAGRRFVDLVPALDPALAKPIVGRGSATGDFDNDGRVDVLIVDYEGAPLLFENRSKTDNHWIKFDLRGAGANAFAYGARITANAAGETWVGEVSPASSYLSSSDPRIHFGLGKLTALDTVTIRWPSGRVEELHDVPADQIVRVAEGAGGAW